MKLNKKYVYMNKDSLHLDKVIKNNISLGPFPITIKKNSWHCLTSRLHVSAVAQSLDVHWIFHFPMTSKRLQERFIVCSALSDH